MESPGVLSAGGCPARGDRNGRGSEFGGADSRSAAASRAGGWRGVRIGESEAPSGARPADAPQGVADRPAQLREAGTDPPPAVAGGEDRRSMARRKPRHHCRGRKLDARAHLLGTEGEVPATCVPLMLKGCRREGWPENRLAGRESVRIAREPRMAIQHAEPGRADVVRRRPVLILNRILTRQQYRSQLVQSKDDIPMSTSFAVNYRLEESLAICFGES